MMIIGTPGGIRTPDLKLRSLLLYPTELPGPDLIGAGGGNRTRDLILEGLA